MTAVPLVGRDREKDMIARLLDGVHDRGGALLVHGEAGVGKSALVSAADNLPPLQRDAIRSAFAMSGSEPPDLFLIALAALELLSDVADRSPVLVVADDAQWLDQSSADVLAFVARRVRWDPIVLLASVRDGHDSPLASAGLPALRLGCLADRQARELFDANIPGAAPAVRERLLAEAAGTPLALLELPEALSSSVRSGVAALPPRLPLTARLENAFAARTAGLPTTTRALLQVTASDDSRELTEIMRATEIVAGAPLSGDDLEPAVKARRGPVEPGDRAEVVSVSPDGRIASVPGLPEAGDHLPPLSFRALSATQQQGRRDAFADGIPA